MLQEPSVAVYTAEQRDTSQRLSFCPPMQFLFRGSDSIELGLGLELCREGQVDNGGEEGRGGGAEGEGERGRGGGWEGQRERDRGAEGEGGRYGQKGCGRVGGTRRRAMWGQGEEYVGVA